MITLTECPRDAMQGLHHFIPTHEKVAYLNQLLSVGFSILDFGSFVSPKAIPQLADTPEVLASLEESDTQLLAIIANRRGAEDACRHQRIDWLGFPFSVSEEFQIRNTNQTREQALINVAEIQKLCFSHQKKLRVYLSMGFGNPYGEPFNLSILQRWIDALLETGVTTFYFSDTIGVGEEAIISQLYQELVPAYSGVEFGIHLHSNPATSKQKIEAALVAGCLAFDSAMLGFGGCPMAKDELTGNLATETLIQCLEQHGASFKYQPEAFEKARLMATELFGRYSN